MAFLLLLHEKMRLKRQVNKLTLKQLKTGNRLDRMTKNIERVNKMYSRKLSDLEKTVKMGTALFKNSIMQQFGIGTDGLNPMNFGGYGGMSMLAMSGISQLAAELQTKFGNQLPNGETATSVIEAYRTGRIRSDGTYQNGVDNTTASLDPNLLAAIKEGLAYIQQSETYARYSAQMSQSQYEAAASIWLEAQQAEIEAEQEEALAPLEAEQTDLELEKDSIEVQLQYAKERLQAIEQACSEGIKESVPKFGLG